MKHSNIREFENIIEELTKNKTVQEMNKYNHHCDVNCFEHCKHVAYINYKICKKLNLDYISSARAGMLHDLFLYDWRKSRKRLDGYHAFVHPKIALENSLNLFNLNDKECDIILKHMWPVTFSLPKYKESFVITFSDKYCATVEILDYFKRRKLKTMLRYAYIFAFLLFINVQI